MARLAAYYREDFLSPTEQRRWYEDNRMRSLATSDPALSQPHQQRPMLYSGHFDNARCRLAGYETNVFDNDSVSSFGEMLAYDNHCLQASRTHRVRKRFSYAEPNLPRHPPQRTLHEAEFTGYNDRLLHPDHHYRPESRQSKWHWGSPHGPPSPLDSGLSSQSITSSPSLEAEPLSFRGEALQPRCLCPKVTYPESRVHRYDSGRLSPGARSVSQHSHVMPYAGRGPMSYAGSEFDDNDHTPSQVRYGKLGIVGESTTSETRKRLDNFREQSYPQSKISYEGAPPKPHRRYTRPCVIIIESPEKNGSSDGTSSPDRDHPGPESPMSVTASNSTSGSPSVSSSNNELEIDDRRKSSKATESEIRELEDMYKKCNLNDRDLLDRAERRDLPTPHQQRAGPRLVRSNSDTLYEVMSPSFHNPYETPRRAPPLRRSGLPDRIADDMALRKLHKPVSTSGFNPADNTITYMLCSTHFTPSVPVGKDILFRDYPDVDLDDLSYRKHYFGKKNKIRDPQPPFGIPLRPPPPQKVFTDYLHVVPSSVPQPLCHARKNPDVVRDDLAFRTLRKEEPERIYYDISQFYKKNKR